MGQHRRIAFFGGVRVRAGMCVCARVFHVVSVFQQKWCDTSHVALEGCCPADPLPPALFFLGGNPPQTPGIYIRKTAPQDKSQIRTHTLAFAEDTATNPAMSADRLWQPNTQPHTHTRAHKHTHTRTHANTHDGANTDTTKERYPAVLPHSPGSRNVLALVTMSSCTVPGLWPDPTRNPNDTPTTTGSTRAPRE